MKRLSSQSIHKLDVRRMCRIALFACLLIIQETVLSMIPGVQLTTVLLCVYFTVFGIMDTAIILFVHIMIDNFIMGSFSIMYTPAMFIGWFILWLLLFIFKRWDKCIWLKCLLGFVHGFLYSWCFLLTSVYLYNVDLGFYLATDILYEVVLSVNNIITIILFYPILSRVLAAMVKK